MIVQTILVTPIQYHDTSILFEWLGPRAAFQRHNDLKFAREDSQTISWRCFGRSDMKESKGSIGMRVLRAAAMLALLLAGPALGQGIKPPAPTDPPKSPGEVEQEKNTNSAYKRSLGNIPDKPPADPWGTARAAEPPKPVSSQPPAKKTKTSTGSTPN
jgi:hypothetical protein